MCGIWGWKCSRSEGELGERRSWVCALGRNAADGLVGGVAKGVEEVTEEDQEMMSATEYQVRLGSHQWGTADSVQAYYEAMTEA